MEYKDLVCKSCGANMEIDYKNHILLCPYCGAREMMVEDGKASEPKKKRSSAKNKKKRNPVLKALGIIGAVIAVMIIALLIFGGVTKHVETHSEYDWPETGLAAMLPEPSSDYGKIHSDYNDTFSMDVYGYKADGFRAYVKDCKERGFTVDERLESQSFEAYNEDGYHLELYLYSYDDDLYIRLDAPVPMSTIDWSGIGAFKALPAPKSDQGYIEWEYSDSARVKVGNTTKEEFAEYVKACKAAGFTEDLSSYDDYYYADQKGGKQHISVSYDGFNTMTVSLSTYD
jgi:DNA-directed RNA polymerase subunit RPC12/RpoP